MNTLMQRKYYDTDQGKPESTSLILMKGTDFHSYDFSPGQSFEARLDVLNLMNFFQDFKIYNGEFRKIKKG